MTEQVELGVSFTLDEALLEEIEKTRGTIAVLELAARSGGVPVEQLREVANGHVFAPSEGRSAGEKAGDPTTQQEPANNAAQEHSAATPHIHSEPTREPSEASQRTAPPHVERMKDKNPSVRPLAVLRSWTASIPAAKTPAAAAEQGDVRQGRGPAKTSVPIRNASVHEHAYLGAVADPPTAPMRHDQSAAPVVVMAQQISEQGAAPTVPSGMMCSSALPPLAWGAPAYAAAPVPAADAEAALGRQEAVAPALPRTAAPFLLPRGLNFDLAGAAVAGMQGEAGAFESTNIAHQSGVAGFGRPAKRTTSRAGDAGDRSDRGSGDERHQMQGDVYLDGALVGRWMSRHLGREAERASANPTAFDVRRGRLLPGPTVR